MERLTIEFANIENVERFVRIAGEYDFNITLSQGRYEVDGKSLMGIFSLDITKPIDINIDNGNASAKALMDEIQEYLS